MKIQGLTAKAVLFITVLIFCSLLFFSFFCFLQIKLSAELKNKDKALSLAKMVSFNSQYGIKVGDINALRSLTSSAIADNDILGCGITDVTGKMLAYSYEEDWKESFLTQRKEPVVEFDKQDHSLEYCVIKEERLLKIDVPIFLSQDTLLNEKNSVSSPGTDYEKGAKITGIVTVYVSLKGTYLFIKKQKWLLGIAGLVTIMIGCLGAVWLVKKVTTPLNELVRGTLELKQGNLDYRLHIVGRDEIGDLSVAFNSMAQELKTKIKELEHSQDHIVTLNKGLESKVTERTHELNEANLKLKELQSNLMTASRQSVLDEMTAKLLEEVSGPLTNVLLLIQDTVPKLSLMEFKETLLTLKELLLLWQDKQKNGQLAALLAEMKGSEKTRGEVSLHMMIGSLNQLEQKSERLLQLFFTFEKEFFTMFDTLARLKENVKPVRNIQEINVKEVIKKVLSISEDKIKAHKVQIEEIYEENLPCLKVDLNDITQVFFNLIQNSIQALEGIVGNPKISISLKTVAKHKVEITFVDNGCGIPEENWKKIFNPGFSTKPQAVGFGLSICRRLLHAYGGIISLKESAPLKETVFAIQIPIE